MEPIVGSFFKAWNRNVYYCESRDSAGYWMVDVRIPNNKTNVSERAIGRTYHQVWNLGLDVQMFGHPFALFGRLSNEDVDAISAFKAKLESSPLSI